jgi:hypothetical protein
MPTIDQALGCRQSDTFAFAITILPYADGSIPDLTGASAVWALKEGNYTGAGALISKTDAPSIVINQDDESNWQVVVGLEPEDTINIPRGMYYHQCKVTLASGDI